MTHSTIAHWRSHIFDYLLSVVACLAIIVALPSIAVTLYHDQAGVALVDTVALAWLLVLWRAREWSYHVRVLHFLGILYTVGVSMMVTVGPVSQIYLLAPPVLGAVLLGTNRDCGNMIPAVLGRTTCIPVRNPVGRDCWAFGERTS